VGWGGGPIPAAFTHTYHQRGREPMKTGGKGERGGIRVDFLIVDGSVEGGSAQEVSILFVDYVYSCCVGLKYHAMQIKI